MEALLSFLPSGFLCVYAGKEEEKLPWELCSALSLPSPSTYIHDEHVWRIKSKHLNNQMKTFEQSKGNILNNKKEAKLPWELSGLSPFRLFAF
jgi:hypothetical protein